MIKEQINTEVLFRSLDATSHELMQLVQDEKEEILNTVPFVNSWTAAQVLIHITKSNKAIAQGLQMHGLPAERNPEQNTDHLKKIFLDFKAKYNSPDFIIPEDGYHNKEQIINALELSIRNLQTGRNETDLSEIIDLPIFGEITKLELLHFVLYHTQRHIRQLKNILGTIKN
ncbi:DinB family protein [Parafilimonas sp.]|uniref:DinB family protein n=1 Tax=Parafilimonas sp. TaxID=1969739 RepID=UPI003F81EC4C